MNGSDNNTCIQVIPLNVYFIKKGQIFFFFLSFVQLLAPDYGQCSLEESPEAENPELGANELRY